MVFERQKSIGRAQSQSKNSVFFFWSGVGNCRGQQVVTGRQISVVLGGSQGELGEGNRWRRVKGKVSRPDLSCRKLFMSLNKMTLLQLMMKNLSVCLHAQQNW